MEKENRRVKEIGKKEDHTKEKQIKEADQSHQGKGKRRRTPYHANEEFKEATNKEKNEGRRA